MVSAVNHLFSYAEQRALGAFVLGRPDLLSFYPVEAQGRKERFVAERQPVTALEFCIKESPDGKAFSKGACLAEMAQACAEQIAVFLTGSAAGHTGFVKEEQFIALKTSDIAVLVNNQQEANAIKKLWQSALWRPCIYPIKALYLKVPWRWIYCCGCAPALSHNGKL